MWLYLGTYLPNTQIALSTYLPNNFEYDFRLWLGEIFAFAAAVPQQWVSVSTLGYETPKMEFFLQVQGYFLL